MQVNISAVEIHSQIVGMLLLGVLLLRVLKGPDSLPPLSPLVVIFSISSGEKLKAHTFRIRSENFLYKGPESKCLKLSGSDGRRGSHAALHKAAIEDCGQMSMAVFQ